MRRPEVLPGGCERGRFALSDDGRRCSGRHQPTARLVCRENPTSRGIRQLAFDKNRRLFVTLVIVANTRLTHFCKAHESKYNRLHPTSSICAVLIACIESTASAPACRYPTTLRQVIVAWATKGFLVSTATKRAQYDFIYETLQHEPTALDFTISVLERVINRTFLNTRAM